VFTIQPDKPRGQASTGSTSRFEDLGAGAGMKFNRIFTNAEHYYSVGIDQETGEHLIEVVITWVAWYSIYFRLMPEEVQAFRVDPNALTGLSYELAADRGNNRFRDRLVKNEGPTR
jgi:hypothetical protein